MQIKGQIRRNSVNSLQLKVHEFVYVCSVELTGWDQILVCLCELALIFSSGWLLLTLLAFYEDERNFIVA